MFQQKGLHGFYLEVVDNDDLMIVTKDGMIIRQPVERINIIGRNTQGVKLIGLNKGDKVFDITRIAAEETEEDEIEVVDENKRHPEEIAEENTELKDSNNEDISETIESEETDSE